MLYLLPDSTIYHIYKHIMHRTTYACTGKNIQPHFAFYTTFKFKLNSQKAGNLLFFFFIFLVENMSEKLLKLKNQTALNDMYYNSSLLKIALHKNERKNTFLKGSIIYISILVIYIIYIVACIFNYHLFVYYITFPILLFIHFQIAFF